MDINDLLLEKHTRKEALRFLSNPRSSILIEGPEGSGRAFLARSITRSLLGGKLTLGSNLLEIEPDEKLTISIGRIRDIKKFVITKSDDGADTTKVILILDANQMTIGAQNALLKILEEPPDRTVIILTSTPGALRPTVISRVQRIRIRPITHEAAASYFKKTAAEINQSFLLSGGLVGKLHELQFADDENRDDEDSPIELAKEIFALSYFDRLKLVDELARNKQQLEELVDAIITISQSTLSVASSASSIDRWHKILKASYFSRENLHKNVNNKLVATNLMLSL